MKPQGLPRWLRLRQRREFLRVQRRGEKNHTRHFLVFVAPRSSGRGRHGPKSAGSSVSGGAVQSAAVSDASQREVTSSPRPGALRPTRVGVTVTRKVGRAHERNRIKRLVREVFRQERTRLPSGFDMVFVAKRNALDVSLEALREDFIVLARRLRRRADAASERSEGRGPRA